MLNLRRWDEIKHPWTRSGTKHTLGRNTLKFLKRTPYSAPGPSLERRRNYFLIKWEKQEKVLLFLCENCPGFADPTLYPDWILVRLFSPGHPRLVLQFVLPSSIQIESNSISTLFLQILGKMGKKVTFKDPLPSSRRKIVILAVLVLTWSLAFTTLSHDGLPPIQAQTTSSSSSEWLAVKKLSCTDTFWVPDDCGMDGVKCKSQANQFTAFHCPANCVRDGVVNGTKPHLAGDKEILGKPLVIGGPIYRGDSYICPTAVHAGVVDDATGGCGVVKFMGMTNSFPGYFMNNVESMEVETYFPLTFRFTVESDELQCPAARQDTKWALPFVSAAHTALVWRSSQSSTVRTVWSLAVIYAHLRLRQDAGAGSRRMSSLLSPRTAPDSSGAADMLKDVPIPQILEPEIFMGTISNATFKWATPVPKGVEGISMWVDDVERKRRYFGDEGAKKNELGEEETADSFVWRRTPQAFVDYIRFGYIKDGKVLKWSQPGVWYTNGTWTGIPPEPKAKARATLA